MADGSVKIDITADDSGVEKKLDDIGNSAEDAGEGLKDLGKGAEDAEKGVDAADIAVGTFVANGLSDLIGKLGEAVSSLFALADETREFRDDMAKLDTAFTDAGHSTETAREAYNGFYRILGESDRSVEAVNHLAELTKNEEELAQWSTIAAGVTAKFGDSLPIEGLTEAANETAKVGAVTGPLADALNWAGISEDEFNEKLAACNSEQERASLITSTLNGEYAAAAEEYNKLTANTQAARDATNNMEQAQAALGAAIEPVTTAFTNMKANALQWLADVGMPSLQSSFQWIVDNLPAVALLIGTLTTAWLTFGGAQKIVDMWNKIIAASQLALNAVMNANPIGLVIIAITALVAVFMILWNNCEGFRNFWIGLWENIKAVASVAWEAIKGFFSAAWEFIKGVWNKVQPYFSALWEGIKKVFSVVKEVLSAYFSAAWEAIKLVWSAVSGYFAQVWETIKGIFSVVKNVLSGNFSEAWEGIKAIFAGWKDYFQGLFNKIGEVFGNIKEKFLTIGKNIVEGLKNGIKNAWSNLKKWFSGLFDDLIGIAKKILGIESPSKEFAYIGEMSGEGVGVGWEKSMDAVEKDLAKDLEGMQGRLQATVRAENARFSNSAGVADTGFADLARAVGTQTAGINSLASEYRKGTGTMRPVIIQLDKRELGRAVVDVGGTEETRTGARLSLGGAY